MSVRCIIGIHNWTKFGLPKSCCRQLSQFRECKRCGVIDSKKIRYEQATPESIKESLDEGKLKEKG